MTHLSIQEVQLDVPGFLQRLRNGEELILEENGIAISTIRPALLVPVGSVQRDASNRIGFLEGQGSFPDNWKEIGAEDMQAALDRLDRL